MENLASLILFFSAGFVVALGSAWLFVKATLHFRKQLTPERGVTLRIRAASGMYRCQLVELGRSAWSISAPIQRDHYVPLRVGEEVVIEAASKQGALIFRSQIVARQTESHILLIQRPAKIHRTERREHKRWPELAGSPVKLEGERGCLIDLSQGGARIQTCLRTHKGDRVRLDLPSGKAVHGWVLSKEGDEARVRFEELMDPRSPQTETAPAV